eukprot:12927838-Prorocentrum_lima.AAC.1
MHAAYQRWQTKDQDEKVCYNEARSSGKVRDASGRWDRVDKPVEPVLADLCVPLERPKVPMKSYAEL